MSFRPAMFPVHLKVKFLLQDFSREPPRVRLRAVVVRFEFRERIARAAPLTRLLSVLVLSGSELLIPKSLLKPVQVPGVAPKQNCTGILLYSKFLCKALTFRPPIKRGFFVKLMQHRSTFGAASTAGVGATVRLSRADSGNLGGGGGVGDYCNQDFSILSFFHCERLFL